MFFKIILKFQSIEKHNTYHVLNSESTSLEWLARTGLVKYHFPPKSNPDTESDVLSLGIITPQADAVVARVDSSSSNDYMELEIVRGFLLVIANIITVFWIDWRKRGCGLQLGAARYSCEGADQQDK